MEPAVFSSTKVCQVPAGNSPAAMTLPKRRQQESPLPDQTVMTLRRFPSESQHLSEMLLVTPAVPAVEVRRFQAEQ